jgi:hypothetical protein
MNTDHSNLQDEVIMRVAAIICDPSIRNFSRESMNIAGHVLLITQTLQDGTKIQEECCAESDVGKTRGASVD